MSTERLQPRAIAYEPRFDRKEGLKASYLSRQIDTFLGERLNVLLSKNKYELKNNLIYGEDMNQPFIEVIKRGVDYRRNAEGENRADRKREEAEIEGFLKTQEVMCNPETPIDTMMLSISPQGGKSSLYQHNFYDIFTLKEAEGKRFIETRRYSSALTVDEYRYKLSPLSFMGNIKNDADFLSNPIRIDPSTPLRVFFQNADQIHSYLHKDHKFTEVEEFERIIKNCERLKQEYIRTRDGMILNAIMNKADETAGLVNFRKDKFYYLIGPSVELKVNDEADFYGKQSVRTVAAGCGSSGNVSTSPFSVSSFGLNAEDIDYDFDQPGPCKKCGAMEGKCGPCGICRSCDMAIRANKKFSHLTGERGRVK